MIVGRCTIGPLPNGAFGGWPPYYRQPALPEIISLPVEIDPRLSSSTLPEFHEFPKIARLSRECVITEKIDGMNACIYIGDDGQFLTGNRTRWITPDDDNFGFSKWAHGHKNELMQLGPGWHFGEWWGVGINRGYGLSEHRFSLFNTSRWGALGTDLRPACCHAVPIIWRGLFTTESVEKAVSNLAQFGSHAAPGFMKPEGVVVYHATANLCFKKTCEHDDQPKIAPRDPNIGGRRKGLTLHYNGPLRRRVENY